MAGIAIASCATTPEPIGVRCFSDRAVAENFSAQAYYYFMSQLEAEGKSELLNQYDLFFRVHGYKKCNGKPGVALQITRKNGDSLEESDMEYLRTLWARFEVLSWMR